MSSLLVWSDLKSTLLVGVPLATFLPEAIMIIPEAGCSLGKVASFGHMLNGRRRTRGKLRLPTLELQVFRS
jgi:hypothetical protein